MHANVKPSIRSGESDRLPSLHARLLDETHLAIGDRELGAGAWPRRSARSLLLLLLATPGHRLSRERAADLLWPDASFERVQANWYQAVSTLRRVLEPDLPSRSASSYLSDDATFIMLRGDTNSWIDVDRFEAGLADADAWPPAERRDRLRSTLAVYKGDLLGDEPEADWATPRREELRLAWQRQVLILAELDLEAGEPLATVAVLQQAAAGDETAEDAHRALMRAFAAAGQRGRALRQYERCRRALAAELGVEPSPTTRLLGESIRRDPPTTPAPRTSAVAEPPPPVRALPAPPATLLIGRDREIETVEELVWRAEARLITVIGPGGIGKTRLVIEVVRQLSHDLTGDVIYVALAGLPAAEFVLPALGEAIGVRPDPGQPVVDSVREHIGEREVLVVLDNLEHVLDAAVDLAGLLVSCPGLTILATSRVPLHIAGEHLVEVPPLATADPRRASFAALARSQAVTLFAHRARAANANFALTEQNAAAVARLCTRLDGLPLAIELAAARIRTLTPASMLALLDQRLDLLAGGPRDAPARLRSMRGAIAWSHDLLDADLQRWFRHLAVFAGGFTLEAAESVLGLARSVSDVGDSPSGTDHPFVGRRTAALDGVAALVDHSLVRPREAADDGSRFDMLETIHADALERLEARGEAAAARLRHAEWFLALAEDGDPEYVGPRSRSWLDRLTPERDNIRAALGWLIDDRHDAIRSLRLASALWWFWRIHGNLTEGRDWLRRALAIADAATPTARARALLLAGDLAWVQGEAPVAAQLIDESERIWRSLGDGRGVAKAHLARGFAAVTSGDDEAAARRFELANAGLTDPADSSLAASALTNLGMIAHRRGETTTGVELLERALVRARASGHRWSIAEPLDLLGDVARDRGDLAGAAGYYRDSLRAYAGERDRWGMGGLVSSIAVLASQVERWAAAARLFGAGAGIYEELRLRSFMFASFRAEYAAAVRAVRDALGDRLADELWHEGRSWDSERMIVEAESVATAIAATPGTADVAETTNVISLHAARRHPT